MGTLSKDQYTISETMLDVGNGHQLYVQDWGNKDAAVPIIFLHGGPGAGCSDSHKAWFDGTRQRVIFHDQRGAGKSTPYGSLEHNTTADLVEDIEKVAQLCRLDSFVVNGGSWGSCLALAYAIKYPQRVKALVLRGIFTGSQSEIDWIDKGGFAALFPDVWEAYLNRTPVEHHNDPSAYHAPRALHGSPAERKASAYAMDMMESSHMLLDDRFREPDYETYDPSSARIEIHYISQRCFMPNNYVLDKAATLTMQVWLIQGRYDTVCAPRGAYELHKRLPDSQLVWTIAGHAGVDRALSDAQKLVMLQLTS